MRISPVSNNFILQNRNINQIESNPKITQPLYSYGYDNSSLTQSNDYGTPQKSVVVNMMFYQYTMGEVKIEMYNDGSHHFNYYQ